MSRAKDEALVSLDIASRGDTNCIRKHLSQLLVVSVKAVICHLSFQNNCACEGGHLRMGSPTPPLATQSEKQQPCAILVHCAVTTGLAAGDGGQFSAASRMCEQWHTCAVACIIGLKP